MWSTSSSLIRRCVRWFMCTRLFVCVLKLSEFSNEGFYGVLCSLTCRRFFVFVKWLLGVECCLFFVASYCCGSAHTHTHTQINVVFWPAVIVLNWETRDALQSFFRFSSVLWYYNHLKKDEWTTKDLTEVRLCTMPDCKSEANVLQHFLLQNLRTFMEIINKSRVITNANTDARQTHTNKQAFPCGRSIDENRDQIDRAYHEACASRARVATA